MNISTSHFSITAPTEGIWQYLPWVSIALSFRSLNAASTKLFFYQRFGPYSDANAPTMMQLMIMPGVFITQIALAIMILFGSDTEQKAAYMIIPIVLSVIYPIVSLFYMRNMLRETRSHLPQIFSKSVVAKYTTFILFTFIAPFSPLIYNPFRKVNLIASSVLILSLLYIGYSMICFGVGAIFFGLFALPAPLYVQVLANYHYMYWLSRCCFCFKPLIHRSMIYDYLCDPEKFKPKNKDHPKFFLDFLTDEMALNCPDADGNTVLHYAAVFERFTELRLMIEKGGLTNIENNKGQTVDLLISEAFVANLIPN